MKSVKTTSHRPSQSSHPNNLIANCRLPIANFQIGNWQLEIGN
jgi:hypothetical protein